MSFASVVLVLALVVIIYRSAKVLYDRGEVTAFAATMGSPVSLEDVKAVSAAMQHATLPMVSLVPKPDANINPLDTRLAGQPWVPDPTHSWPQADGSGPLCFLGQVNFAQIPPMEDFPRQGLLQVFADVASAVSPNGWSMHGRSARDMRHAIRWFPDPSGGQFLVRPDDVSDFAEKSLRFDGDVPANGLAVDVVAKRVQPPAFALPPPHCDMCFPDATLQKNRAFKDRSVKRAARRLENESFDWKYEQDGHRVGGHPLYVQGNRKDRTTERSLDRVLLQLRYRWDRKDVFPTYMTLAIGQDELRKGQLDRAKFFWSVE